MWRGSSPASPRTAWCDSATCRSFAVAPSWKSFFRTRAARQKGYRLRKELKAHLGDLIVNTWDGEWEDSQTGAKMIGHGVEIWTMRDGKIAVWDAAFNFKQAGKTSAMGIV